MKSSGYKVQNLNSILPTPNPNLQITTRCPWAQLEGPQGVVIPKHRHP